MSFKEDWSEEKMGMWWSPWKLLCFMKDAFTQNIQKEDIWEKAAAQDLVNILYKSVLGLALFLIRRKEWYSKAIKKINRELAGA